MRVTRLCAASSAVWVPILLASLLEGCAGEREVGRTEAPLDQVFHVDPVHGSPDGDGSAEDPWRTLQEVWEANLIETRDWELHPPAQDTSLVPKNEGAPVGPGDTLLLYDGYHGDVSISMAYNELPITVEAAPGHTPQLRRLNLLAVSNWVFRGLSVSPSHGTGPQVDIIVNVGSTGWQGPSSDVTVEGCEVFTVDDASHWSAQDWNDQARIGMSARLGEVVFRNNRVRNTSYGIAVGSGGANALVEGNLVDGFSGDGLRGLADDSVFAHNVVKNAWETGNGHHDDLFQSWTIGPSGVGTGAVRNVTLRGNVFISNDQPDHPLAQSNAQGIGCFDGFFDGWIVDNNLVVTTHWHGISFYGMRNSRIVNNTVVSASVGSTGPPWIRVTNHKDGTPSDDVVVRNNIINNLSNHEDGLHIAVDHNLAIGVADNSTHFVDALAGDFRLLRGSTAVDSGSAELAPASDLEGTARPQGSAVDIGAYEWHRVEEPADAGTGGVQDAGAGGLQDAGTGSPDDAGPGSNGGGGGSAPPDAGRPDVRSDSGAVPADSVDAGPGDRMRAPLAADESGRLEGTCAVTTGPGRHGPAWMAAIALAVLGLRRRRG